LSNNRSVIYALDVVDKFSGFEAGKKTF